MKSVENFTANHSAYAGCDICNSRKKFHCFKLFPKIHIFLHSHLFPTDSEISCIGETCTIHFSTDFAPVLVQINVHLRYIHVSSQLLHLPHTFSSHITSAGSHYFTLKLHLHNTFCQFSQVFSLLPLTTII